MAHGRARWREALGRWRKVAEEGGSRWKAGEAEEGRLRLRKKVDPAGRSRKGEGVGGE